jgi:pantothenate kinase
MTTPSTPTVEELTLADVIAQARSLAVPGTRRILGLTGAPGAGKSTVAAHIVEALGPESAVLVPMDGFHLANEVLLSLERRDRKGAHDTFDDDGYAHLIERVHAQKPTDAVIYAPVFRREIEEPIGSSIGIHPETPLVVTEGNYLLLDKDAWPKARAAVDAVWFLAPAEDLRHERLIRRHQAYGKSIEDARFWTLGSDQINADLIHSTARHADRVIRIID